MNQSETQWDKLLKIKTTGRDDTHSDQYRYPYEPTAYTVLERLANSGLIRKNNTVLDYGTGKGRVCFFLSYQTRCRSIGVEYDERIYQEAAANRSAAVSGSRTSFVLSSAENYEVPAEVDRCYFLIPLLWRFYGLFLQGYMNHITGIQEACCCFSIIHQKNMSYFL